MVLCSVSVIVRMSVHKVYYT